MIPAGRLTHTLTIERMSETVAPSGAVSEVWTPIATVRAELVQRDLEQFYAGPGEADAARVVFRIRYSSDLTTADRIVHAGVAHDLLEIVELGRRQGLELRAIAR